MNKLYVIGIGPGSYENLTIRADRALQNADLIIGYTVYIDLVKAYYPNKEYRSTPMKQEIERCKLALEEAKHKNVAMVCSGDASVYGMASLMYELAGENSKVELEIIPGITAALGGGALLGAPLSHDFAVISLSDLLTPWKTIEIRLKAAAEADFCICLYNPSSKKRWDYLQKACDILLQYKPTGTVCGIAKNIAREGETCEIVTLQELRNMQVDMFTTVFIGNKETKRINNAMVTPRGYL